MANASYDVISNTDDIIDSRTVIERIEFLEALLQDRHQEEDESASPDDFAAWVQAASENDAHTLQDAAKEYRALQALAAEAEGYADDWQYGEALIRDSYFERYAQELADDIGAIPANTAWPLTCIDWTQAARELQMDYTAVEFDGVTYWIR